MSNAATIKNLICIRHGESEYNQKNLFTGTYDVVLTNKGIEEAKIAGRICQKYTIDFAYCSELLRAKNTLDTLIKPQGTIPQQCSAALNERDYGDLTGLNKAHACERYGADKVKLWRRGFHAKPPNGESLAETFTRVKSFYNTDISPMLSRVNNVLVVAHGNSLRALTGHLLDACEAEFEHIEIAWCSPWIFTLSLIY